MTDSTRIIKIDSDEQVLDLMRMQMGGYPISVNTFIYDFENYTKEGVLEEYRLLMKLEPEFKNNQTFKNWKEGLLYYIQGKHLMG